MKSDFESRNKILNGRSKILCILFVLVTLVIIKLVFTNDQKPFYIGKSALIDNLKPKVLNLNRKFDIGSIISNPNDYVYSYVNLPLSFDYGSNAIPLTLAALIAPSGSFLELGMGLFSTPLLHKIANDRGLDLVSVDTDFNWMKKFTFYNSTRYHKIYFMRSPNELMSYGTDRNWSLVLVDHIYGDKRPQNVIDFAQKAQIVVAHDTEKSSEPGYLYEKRRMRDYFKHVCKFSLYITGANRLTYISTTLMSNYIDLSGLLKPALDTVLTDYGHVSCDVSL